MLTNSSSTTSALVRYCLVGAFVTATYGLSFLALSALFPAERTSASIIAYALGCGVQYVGNALYTFRRRTADLAQFLRYLTTVAIGLLVSTLLLTEVTPALGLPDGIAVLIASATVIAINFVLMLTWTFASKQVS